MPNNDFISNILEIKDLIITNVESYPEEMHIYFKIERRDHVCPCCGAVTNKVHDYRTEKVETEMQRRINASVDPFEKSVIDEVRRGKHDIINNSRKNMIETVGKKKRKLKIATAAIPIAGAIIGAVYGRDNNLKKQRDKIEDAAGDRVADIVRGKKEK